MADEQIQSANAGAGETPSESLPENQTQDGTQTQPTAESQNTEGNVPFNEIVKKPEFQEFWNRQLEKGISVGVQAELAKLGVTQLQQKQQEKSELAALGLEEQTIKALEEWSNKRIQKVVEPLQKRLIDQESSNTLQLRAASLRNRVPDFDQHTQSMMSIFNNLTESERNFVLSSDKGIKWLYDEAKQKSSFGSGKTMMNTPSGRSSSMETKTGNFSSVDQQISEALASGNKSEFDRLVKMK